MDNSKIIWLSIDSTILYDDDEPQTFTLKTEGKLSIKNDMLYIMYEESELSGMKGDKTLLKISENSFSMRRYGANTLELNFTPNEETTSFYNTPQGRMPISCHTNELEICLEPLRVQVKYDLVIAGYTKSKNEMNIEIYTKN